MGRNYFTSKGPIIPPAPGAKRGIATTGSGDSLYKFGQYHVTKGVGRITEGIISKGQGSYVEYQDGRRMLDFTCGIGVTNLGEP